MFVRDEFKYTESCPTGEHSRYFQSNFSTIYLASPL